MNLLNKIDVSIVNATLEVASLGSSHSVQLIITDQNGTIVHNSTFNIPPTQVISLAGYNSWLYKIEITTGNEKATVILNVPEEKGGDFTIIGGIVTLVQGRTIVSQITVDLFCTSINRTIKNSYGDPAEEGYLLLTRREHPSTITTYENHTYTVTYDVRFELPWLDYTEDHEAVVTGE